MPRQPLPWFRKQTGWWKVCLNGERLKLAKGKSNKKEALKRFHELMARMVQRPESPDARVAEVAEASAVKFRWARTRFVEAEGACFSGLLKGVAVARIGARRSTKAVGALGRCDRSRFA